MKAKSVGAKIRNKKKNKGVKSLYEEFMQDAIPVHEADNPLETVTEARQRQMGATYKGDILSAMLSCDAGRAIADICGDTEDARKLFDAFIRYDNAKTVYFRRVLSRKRFPAVSSLDFMPERFETRSDDSTDIRTEDEKVADSREAMNRWGGYLGKIKSHERVAIRGAVDRTARMHDNQGATSHGKRFVAAMRRLVDAME